MWIGLINVRPAIAIEQKNPIRTARSTVGTTTEIADLLRLLFAKIGHPVCPDCAIEARSFHPGSVVDDLLSHCAGARAMILFPVDSAGAETRPGLSPIAVDCADISRVQCGEELLDLHETHTLPETRPDHLAVVLDRLVIREDNRSRLVEAIETAFREGEGLCRVEVIDHGSRTYSTDFRCQRCGRTFEPIRPVLFSFNHPLGACPECKGFGNILRYDPDLVIPDHSKSLAQGAIEPWSKPSGDWWQKQMLLSMKRRGVDLTIPYKDFRKQIQQMLWQGEGKMEGVQQFFEYLEGKRYKLHVRVMLSRYRTPVSCPAVMGLDSDRTRAM